MVFILTFTSINSPAFSADYNVTLTREDSNVYEITNWSSYSEKWRIITKWCYEYVYWDNAILRYNPYNSEIIFSDGTSCDVEQIEHVIIYR